MQKPYFKEGTKPYLFVKIANPNNDGISRLNLLENMRH